MSFSKPLMQDDRNSTQHERPGNPEPAECRRACGNSLKIALRLLPNRHHGMMDVLAWNGASSCDGVPSGQQPKAHSLNSKLTSELAQVWIPAAL